MFGRKPGPEPLPISGHKEEKALPVDAVLARQLAIDGRGKWLAARARERADTEARRRERIFENIRQAAKDGQFSCQLSIMHPDWANPYGIWADESDMPFLRELGFTVKVQRDYPKLVPGQEYLCKSAEVRWDATKVDDAKGI